jgi:hypothetical protein
MPGRAHQSLDNCGCVRHKQIVLMTRDGSEKHKFLLGRDEHHWFAGAVTGDGVRDVRTAIASLRPTEIEGREAIRQDEWFFVPEPGVNDMDIPEIFSLIGIAYNPNRGAAPKS